MDTADSSRAGRGLPSADPAVPPSGLLDLLSVAAVVLDAEGKVVFWSPHAEELFGYTADEALGRFAAQLMVHEEHWDEVIRLFTEVMESGTDWAGIFPTATRTASSGSAARRADSRTRRGQMQESAFSCRSQAVHAGPAGQLTDNRYSGRPTGWTVRRSYRRERPEEREAVGL